MNTDEFYNALKNINIELSVYQKQQFERYYDFLIEYNKKTNVTSITDKKEVYLKHFYDSILLSQALDISKVNTMLDIGCGAGFPGIVIKIIYPNIKLTLLDSNNKKTFFCSELIKKLNLSEIEVITERAEVFIEKRREYYDLVTARAVKRLDILNELAIPFVKISGFFIAMKSNYREELNESLEGIKKLGGKYIETKNTKLPNNAGERNFIIIEKIERTNAVYPRKYNQIIKKPL